MKELDEWWNVVDNSSFDEMSRIFLIKSAQDHIASNGPAQIDINLQVASFQQTAKCKMRMFQGSFPRVKDWFIHEDNGEHKRMLLNSVQIFNLCKPPVGLIQFKYVFMSRSDMEKIIAYEF